MTLTLTEQCEEYRAKKKEASDAKSVYDDLKADADELEVRLLERFEHERTSGHKTDTGTSFSRAETVYGNVNDRAVFVTWAEENAPELVESKERKALVSELVRERLDNKEELPPGVDWYAKSYISTKAS